MYTKLPSARQRVRTAQGPAYHRVHFIGPHPIVRHFLDRMAFFPIVQSCLGSPRDAIVDHAQTLAVLVHNILVSPAPMYRIAEWTAPISPCGLGLSSEQKASVNDDRVGRTLDALVSPRGASVFFRLAVHIIKRFELETQRMHHDTTTVTFTGAYKGSIREPRITYGMNKDHRPDLKQLVFGINVTADGAVPVSHEIYSGNRTDDSVHRSNLETLRAILAHDDFIYVADSKLCTRKNLRYIDTYGGKFVTVLPRTWAEDKTFRTQLRQGPPARWRRLLALENEPRPTDGPDVYWSTTEGPQQTKEGYRVLWYRSSQKMTLDAEKREKGLAKAEAELFALGSRINRRHLRKRAAIKKHVNAILHDHGCQHLLKVSIEAAVQIATRHLRPGRPRQGDPVRQIRSRIFRLVVRRDPKALRSEARTDGVFPLVTNLAPATASKQDVLLMYKYQPYVEKRHALMKSELEVAPVYLKKPSRVAGLIHAVFVAMMVDALIERTIRQAMERRTIEALPILPEGRNTRTPTTARVLELFSDIAWYEFQRGRETVSFPVRLSLLQKKVLGLLGMDASVYM